MNNIEKAEELFRNYKLDESREIIDDILESDPNNLKALIILGKIHSRSQNYGEAMNFFNRVLELDTDNQDAIVGIKLIKNILQLANNYYYENPYTDDDLYDFNK